MKIPTHDRTHQWGESATHPRVPRSRVLAALRLVAGIKPALRLVAGIKPAFSSRLASPRLHDPLVRVQLPDQG